LTLLDKREGTGICRGSYLYNLHSLSLSWRLVPDNNADSYSEPQLKLALGPSPLP
jgi:hypothetical protein